MSTPSSDSNARDERADAPDTPPNDDTRPTDLPKPIGDAIPAPTEPGLDQPLPPKSRDKTPDDKSDDRPDQTPEPAPDQDAPPADLPRPFGDAVPAPTEPGLDQPLPPKHG
ncbi:conserved hypothetical protein [Paraburkholderia tropica]|uniref:hypothetical protein n=1 Tax=Paraburkholderia tropica TaxID=92647 RepID=UPI001CB5A253|nr:hypothetical protein [Paraburkholderia tropica]CAG9213163.1 conserved hypothetical protein [Paraburkholderia tropica]